MPAVPEDRAVLEADLWDDSVRRGRGCVRAGLHSLQDAHRRVLQGHEAVFHSAQPAVWDHSGPPAVRDAAGGCTAAVYAGTGHNAPGFEPKH